MPLEKLSSSDELSLYVRSIGRVAERYGTVAAQDCVLILGARILAEQVTGMLTQDEVDALLATLAESARSLA